MRFSSPWMLVAAALALLSCASKPKGLASNLLGVCSAKAPRDADEKGLPRAFFLELLVHNFDKRKGTVGPVQDCTGATLVPERLGSDCQAQPMEVLSTLPASEQMLKVEAVHADTSNVAWIPLRSLSNGEALGPVAWVDVRSHGKNVAVVATGGLQIFPERVSLKMDQVSGVHLLVAEGEKCEEGKADKCQREVHLLVLRGSRFFQEPVVTKSGDCAGPATIPLVQTRVLPMPEGWVREFRQANSVTVGQDEVRIHEELSVVDRDARQPGTPARVVRRAQSDRSLKLAQRGWIVDSPSLWTRIPEFQGR
jgi:hypothetical protein